MWQKGGEKYAALYKSVLQITAFKIGSIAFKVWHLALAATCILATIGVGSAYIASNQQKTALSPTSSTIHQHVIIFISGLGTSIQDCQKTEHTFASIETMLAKTLPPLMISNDPYTHGCAHLLTSPDLLDPDGRFSYLNASYAFVPFSYNGGSMVSANVNGGPTLEYRGVWEPNGYQPCDANNDTLSHDVHTFDNMLDTYRRSFPYATFTIVGHSLGGLVALEGATDYTQKNGSGIIDKVMAIDSPLNGVPIDKTPLAEGIGCDPTPLKGGNVLFDINGLYTAGPSLAESRVAALEAHGTAVYTLGNTSDCLYRGYDCSSLFSYTDTQFVSGAYIHRYDYPQSVLTHVPPAGHGAVLIEHAAVRDIVRYILAPVVTFAPSTTGRMIPHSMNGTPVSVTVTVHCPFGQLRHAHIALTPTTRLAGAMANHLFPLADFQGSGSSPMLSIHGSVVLPWPIAGPATITVDASGSSCDYPVREESLRPTLHDYQSTQSIDIVGGLLAVLQSHKLEVQWPLPNASPLVTIPIAGTAASMAWSPDGTRIAYLVKNDTSYQGPNTISVVDIASDDVQTLYNFPGEASSLAWGQRPDGRQFLAWYVEKLGSFDYTKAVAPLNRDVMFYNFQQKKVDQLSLGAVNVSDSGICGDSGCNGSPSISQTTWSADGAYLLTPLGVVDLSGKIYTTAGFSTFSMERSDGDGTPTWSPQQDVLALPINTLDDSSNSQYSSTLDLYQIPNNSGQLKKMAHIASYAGHIISAAWSPDDSSIITCSESLGLQSVDVHGGSPHTLSATPCLDATWNPDQTSILATTLYPLQYCPAMEQVGNGLCGGPLLTTWTMNGIQLISPANGQTQTLINCDQQCQATDSINTASWQPGI